MKRPYLNERERYEIRLNTMAGAFLNLDLAVKIFERKIERKINNYNKHVYETRLPNKHN